MHAKTHSSPPAILTVVGDAALIDAKAAAAAGSLSVSWWLREVRAGKAPQPAFRSPRCTRWRLSDVRAFWLTYTAAADHNAAAERAAARSMKATQAAAAKRKAAITLEAH